MKKLEKQFESREALIEYVQQLAPYADGIYPETQGGVKAAQQRLSHIDPINYGATRNYGNGKVTRLSPYIHHGTLSLNHVRNVALEKCSDRNQIKKFIQELAWRDFWQRVARNHPDWLWADIEDYKTGYTPHDYADQLPEDIATAQTGVACVDAFIRDLTETGYVHNHARMYLASYVVHFRRVKWQAGAQWFLEHLLDGDEASNNFSWQWVASTFSNKPYIFNLENVDKFFGGMVDTSPENNQLLDATYEELNARLFPHKGGDHA